MPEPSKDGNRNMAMQLDVFRQSAINREFVLGFYIVSECDMTLIIST